VETFSQKGPYKNNPSKTILSIGALILSQRYLIGYAVILYPKLNTYPTPPLFLLAESILSNKT